MKIPEYYYIFLGHYFEKENHLFALGVGLTINTPQTFEMGLESWEVGQLLGGN